MFDPDVALSVIQIAAAGAAAASVAAAVMSRLSTRRDKETFESRVKRLTDSLGDASRLVSQIEREVATRNELAERLKQDVAHYSHLKALDAPQVEAIAQTLRGEVQKESRKSFWRGFVANFLFFALGVLVTLVVR